jgi:hypothetical protein
VNYNSLEAHFRKEHFLCSEKECLDKKFVVFESEIDLKAHQLEVHPGGFSKDARKDARRIDMSGFDFRTPHQPERNNREGRGRGRGRDPNTEPIPQSTAQSLRRDELAYQRQMAIQSAQSVSSRTFGGQLTNNEASIRPSSSSIMPSTSTPHPPSLSSLDIQDKNSTQGMDTPQDQARALRHAAVTSRAVTLLQSDSLKLATFRSNISSYRSSTLSATSLIDSFFSLFDCPAVEVGKLIRDLADIFEVDSKRNDLLKAWNDWRAINEDYPALPGPSGIIPGMSARTVENGGKRLLNLKNSTTQSSRSSVSRSESWGSSPNPKSANPFPSLSSPSTSSWSSSANGQSTNPRPTPTSSTSRPVPMTLQPRTKSNDPIEAFPALPSSSKPSTSFGYGLGGRGSNSGNPWGGNSSSGVSAAASDSELVDDGPKKKKGGKKKQVLFHYG